MLFAIICQDVPGSLPKRQSARPDHLARLETLQQQGRLVLAGPFPAIDNNDPGPAGFTGSLIVAEFASQAEAEDWANQDPYLAAGVYEQVTVKPFKQVFPKIS
ncbi:YciI family protein [Spartinivicinus ruber]|uniref:YciI family protein n=1 Tax=Spartinivicinus ruber TaxID=2683272 RepID=UPI0013D73D01|nr:YciI family protein [Spartinivicinus ruber]